ncbi:flotillin family protein [Cystobacter ferrugineus]|uniref:Flotillin family protein n=1 Tax=Cystobacter ferrugineus TaxID=83449 RepID=A0A1L9BDC5_9BACT|nr:flotillin family protein [Cystobacter ferrugineus]OJH40257.1 flotillin family protein [Cystobacter ferrugineus]
MTVFAVLVVVLVLAAAAVAAVARKLIHICQPNEVLIFSGTRRLVEGQPARYRLVHGGRGLRIPLLERVDSLDLTNMVIAVGVKGAYSKGGIPLNVESVANVKVASGEPILGNAIERFLGKPRAEVVRVAKETLEGNLRGVLATLTPEEVNGDRARFAQCLLQEADHDLNKLGLVLDTLKIQSVSDDRGFLNALGRKQSAALQMRSRIAEAENHALAAERAAHNREVREVARLEAEFSVARADAERRILEAQARQAARVAEERGLVVSQLARARAEVDVQRVRIEQVRLLLEADVLKPAEARRQEQVAAARGAASRIVEEGRATATSLAALARTWEDSDGSARQILLAQKLAPLLESLLGPVGQAPVERLTMLDARLGGSGELSSRVALVGEQLKHVLGVDPRELLRRLAGPPPAAQDA